MTVIVFVSNKYDPTYACDLGYGNIYIHYLCLLTHQYNMCLCNRPMYMPEPDAVNMTMIVTMTIL